MLGTLRDGSAPETHDVQYFEMFGNRGIYHQGWTAVTKHRTPWKADQPPPFDDDIWELYGPDDWTQAHDLAAENPEKLAEMQRLWLIEAVKYNVVPLDDRGFERINPDIAGRPQLIRGNTQLLFDRMRVSENCVLNLKNKSHSVTANIVVPESGANGVIVTQGGSVGGWTLYAHEGRLKYCYNFFGIEYYIVTADDADSRRASIRCGWSSPTTAADLAKGGDVTLYYDGKPVGTGRVEQTSPMGFSADEACDVGSDTGSPASPDYGPTGNRFTGEIEWVQTRHRRRQPRPPDHARGPVQPGDGPAVTLDFELNSTYGCHMAARVQSRGAMARDRLLYAATDELAETGEIEVAAVARRAEVSVGLPYRYFVNRTGLLIAVQEAFYQRLGDAAAMRIYDAPTWAERELQRIRDWVAFLYDEPVAPMVLAGFGDAEVAAANTRHLHELIEVGARNMAQAQRAGELPAERDPEFMAAATLGGTNAVVAVCLTRVPRPPAESVVDQLWAFVSGAVGLPQELRGKPMSHNTSGAARTIESVDELGTDLAGRHKFTASSGATVDPAIVDADLAAVERDGYVILEGLLTAADCAEIKAAVGPLLNKSGRNTFEGLRTRRLYNVLNKTRSATPLVEHPRILALLDRLLLPNYLLSQLQAIDIDPGEQAQLLHHDDGMYPVPRPRPPLSAATIWAIDAFTDDNGATVVVPGSHRWGAGRPPTGEDQPDQRGDAARLVCVLRRHPLAWGRRQPDRPVPLAITAQYCEPWLRPQENFTLSTPRETVQSVSEDLRRMLGYSIHPPFVGMVDGVHPKRLLEDVALPHQDNSRRKTRDGT